MTDRPKALVTAPFRGEGLDTLRELADVVLDPWIDHQPLRIYDGEKLAARIKEESADVLIVETDFVHGPVFDLPLRAIGSCRGPSSPAGWLSRCRSSRSPDRGHAWRH